jgi:GNAT superfamily N-acetyltransferase
VRFREWSDADVDEIAALVVRCDALTAEWAPPGWKLPDGHAEREIEIWREELGNENWRAEVAVDSDGSIVGVIGTDAEHVASLFVEPRLHGQGLGTTLLGHAEEWIRAGGFDRATLNVLEGSPAIRLYERCGWTRTRHRDHYAAFDMPTDGYEKGLSPRRLS